MTEFSRRTAFVATASLFAAARAATPRGAFAQSSTTPEVKGAKLGYIALTDAAPLIIAKEKGIFAKYGMPDVIIDKQASWGSTRDNLVLGGGSGGIDGAHILTPMVYMIHAGKVVQNNQPVPMVILARLNINGQGISVAAKHQGLRATVDASPLKPVLTQESKVAMTFRGGTHDLWLRYWLAAAGIDPDKDVQTIVVPPPQMVANIKVGTMDAFCVGAPWNDQAVHQHVGHTATETGELWMNHPEKSLGMRADWVAANPRAAEALTAAVIEAQRWCDTDANKQEMCAILSRRAWFNVPVADIYPRSLGNFDYGDGRTAEKSPLMMKFWRDNASYPYQSHDLWFLTEDIRWGIFAPDTDTARMIAQVNKEGIWRAAAARAGVPNAEVPSGTSRGRETFFDGKVFDPADPAAYLASQGIKNLVGA
ncbi:nitrate/nitrite transport system substrate-binding protein [Humitalea rosea]|uniref:Nitrate/nitrite transport system substrate-binding protein n=1 Tax=Humitalea rosea TaxID=990373 RepID=A0A2W7IU88_9PROT|nr:CmpA/NrtA family ABC transporter substrate-binding protein [Humitalea rosea]PZW43037.1 nitrate/nitrite transport system substrate-binding protein [Humitalea rosea]